MTRLRRALVPVAAIWLSCQVGAVAVAPVALWVSAADPHGMQCTCGHGADETCPMHHHKSGSAPANRCTMRPVSESGTAVLTTVIGATGVMPEAAPSLVAPVPSMNVRAREAGVRAERSVPPDPPPPRA